MKACTYCGRGNEIQASVCAECGTELPPSVPPPLEHHEFVRNGELRRVVARLSRIRQAEFLRDGLVTAGIDATIEDQSVRGFLGFVNPVDRILVHVPVTQAGAADPVIRNLMPPGPGERAASTQPRFVVSSPVVDEPGTRTCSYCGRENPAEALACSGCGTLAPGGPSLTDPSANLVVVARCATVVDANIVLSHLQRVGIEACVPEEYNTPIFWSGPASPVGVTVQVRASDESRALQALEEAAEVPPSPPPPPVPPAPPVDPLPPPPPIIRAR